MIFFLLDDAKYAKILIINLFQESIRFFLLFKPLYFNSAACFYFYNIHWQQKIAKGINKKEKENEKRKTANRCNVSIYE